MINETSATGGNSGSVENNVLSIGVDIGSHASPNTTGDLIESPISTSPEENGGSYGIPIKKPTFIKSKKDGKIMKVLSYDDYIKTKMNKITRLKK